MLQIRKIIIKIVIKYLFSLERKYQMLANMWGGRILMGVYIIWASLGAQMVKSLPATQEIGFDHWVRKIPWRRKWQATPLFLPGKSHEQRTLARHSPCAHTVSDKTSDLAHMQVH